MRTRLWHEGWLEDGRLPPGWLVKLQEGKLNGKIWRSYRLLNSRDRRGLYSCNVTTAVAIATHSLFSESEICDYRFLTSEGELLDSAMAAAQHMKETGLYSRHQVRTCRTFHKKADRVQGWQTGDPRVSKQLDN